MPDFRVLLNAIILFLLINKMKSGLFVIAFLCFFVPAMAQSASTEENPLATHHVKLIRLKVRTMADEKRDGYLWAITDSTLLYFSRDRMTVRALRAGIQPQLDIIGVTAIKQITAHRKSHFARATGIGIVMGSVLFALTWTDKTPTWDALILKVLVGGIMAPAFVISSIVIGLLPPLQKSIRGSRERFHRVVLQLSPYNVVSLIQTQ